MINKLLLFNDDCISAMKTLEDKSISAIICDLPYGTTNNPWDTIIPLEPLWKEYNRIIEDNGAIVLTSSQPFTSILINSNINNFKYEWIWNKTISSGSMNAKIMPLKNHESILVFSGNSKKVKYYPQMTHGKPYKTKAQSFKSTNYGEQTRPEVINEGWRYPTSIVKISNPRIKNGHPTQKPIDLMKYFIKTYTKPNDIVLDNCMGSGSTGVACIELSRNFIGIELNKEYFDVAKARIEATVPTTTTENNLIRF